MQIKLAWKQIRITLRLFQESENIQFIILFINGRNQAELKAKCKVNIVLYFIICNNCSDTKYRLRWENALCTRDRKYFCQDHKMVLCNTCHTALHLRCCTDVIADKKDVQECIDYIKNLINKIIGNSELFKTHKYIKDFDLEIKRYRDLLQSIEQKVQFSSTSINCLVYDSCWEGWVHRIRSIQKECNSVGNLLINILWNFSINYQIFSKSFY